MCQKIRPSASSPPIFDATLNGVPRSEHASDTSDWGRGSSSANLSSHSELPTLSKMGRVNRNYHDLSPLGTSCHYMLILYFIYNDVYNMYICIYNRDTAIYCMTCMYMSLYITILGNESTLTRLSRPMRWQSVRE